MISIIMPVYNTEAYLQEAVESIIGQSLPFRENIMLYLLDDASTDDSLAVCRDYERQHPENIKVVHFDENQGVSAVRNFGLSLCREHTGTIVGFVDSDDRLHRDALKRVEDFFDGHRDVNMAVAEIYFFGAKEGSHKLNWRFDEREVVHILEDYTYPQYYIGGAFFQQPAWEKLSFDETMNFWEDALAVNQVILAEEKYGLIKDAVYYYRKREDESSLVDSAWHDRGRYIPFLDHGYLRLMDYCKKEKRRLLPYIQFVVVYHMRLFMVKSRTEVVHELMDNEDLAIFRKKLRKILRRIKTDVIVHIPTTLPVVEAMLSIRKGKKVRARRTYTEDDCIFSYRGYEFTRMSERSVYLSGIVEKPEERRGMWRGRFNTPIFQMAKEDHIFAEHNGVRVDSIRCRCQRELYILGEKMRNYRYAGFMIAIPEEWESARFGIHTKGIDIMLNEVVFAEVLERIESRKREEEEGEEDGTRLYTYAQGDSCGTDCT
ncbi:MAG: glycosyltransferase family 2 protein [Eubacterium sp.]|nr:glycosyltransferase family 2 protein [Eubacterium sp.]